MNDILALCAELRSRIESNTANLVRLAEENERLRRENEALRREATVARLRRDMETPGEVTFTRFGPDASGDTLDTSFLYERLPHSFSFSEFFNVASDNGLDEDAAKRHMIALLRAHLLLQRGTRIEKRRPASVGTDG